jgi:hypothetical protein
MWIEDNEDNAACIFTADLERRVMSAATFVVQCAECDAVFFISSTQVGCNHGKPEYATPFLKSAYITARHARFEHGEKGMMRLA